MTTLAPHFADPFVGVPQDESTDWHMRAIRYMNLLEAARNCIRKLETELEERDERIDDLQQQVWHFRHNPPQETPRTIDTDGRPYASRVMA
jgi:hypothetical protein